MKRLYVPLLIACVVLGLTRPAIAADGAALPATITLNRVEFVLIPAGEFWYTVGTGARNASSAATPLFRDVRVWLPSFYMARYEARASDFLRFMNSARPTIPAARVSDYLGNLERRIVCGIEPADNGDYRLTAAFRDQPDWPALNLSWSLADQFARWMGFRLPTEAEWQKAARGPDDKRLWPWGNTYPDDTHAYYYGTVAPCEPMAVNTLPKGRSPYGIHHMAGNVAEWVADWHDEQFDAGLQDGQGVPPPRTEEPARSIGKLLKGGRFGAGAHSIAIPFRNPLNKDYYFNPHDGVRFAVDVETVLRQMQSDSGMTFLPSPN